MNQIIPGETALPIFRPFSADPAPKGHRVRQGPYISEVMVEPPGGRKRASTRTLIVISLDGEDIVTAIEVRDETSGKTIAYLDERSPTGRYLRSNGTAVLHPSSKAEINLT